MAGITDTSQLQYVVNTIRAKAKFTMQDPGVFPGLFDGGCNPPKGARSYTEPKFGTVTAYDLTESVDMAQAQQLTDSLPLTLTPTEVGCQVIYSRIAAETRTENVASAISKVITNAIKKKRAQDGAAMLDGFSTSLGSGSTTTVTRGYLSAARALIRGNSTEPNLEETPVVVMHEYSFNDLVDLMSEGTVVGSVVLNVGLAGLPEDFAKKYMVMNLAGMPIFTDGNITVSSSAAKGGIFCKSAVAYGELWGLEIEPEKDASLRGWEVNGTICYDYAERNDNHGVELNIAAATPSS